MPVSRAQVERIISLCSTPLESFSNPPPPLEKQESANLVAESVRQKGLRRSIVAVQASVLAFQVPRVP